MSYFSGSWTTYRNSVFSPLTPLAYFLKHHWEGGGRVILNIYNKSVYTSKMCIFRVTVVLYFIQILLKYDIIFMILIAWGGTIYFLFPKNGGILNIEVIPYYFFIYKLYLGVCPKSRTVGGRGLFMSLPTLAPPPPPHYMYCNTTHVVDSETSLGSMSETKILLCSDFVMIYTVIYNKCITTCGRMELH